MIDFEDVLLRKRIYYGNTDAAFDFAAEEYATLKVIAENEDILKIIPQDSKLTTSVKKRIKELKASISEIDIDRKDLYLINPELNVRIRQRLIQLSEMGLKDIGLAQFGLPGIVSGLYVEMVWCHSETKWNGYIKFLQDTIADAYKEFHNSKD